MSSTCSHTGCCPCDSSEFERNLEREIELVDEYPPDLVVSATMEKICDLDMPEQYILVQLLIPAIRARIEKGFGEYETTKALEKIIGVYNSRVEEEARRRLQKEDAL